MKFQIKIKLSYIYWGVYLAAAVWAAFVLHNAVATLTAGVLP